MELAVLGPVRVLVDGRPVAVGGPKLRLLLAVLSCNPGRVVGSGRLIEALWGAAAPRSAADNLRLYVHRLRRVLGREWIVGTNRSGYQLRLGAEQIDAHRFSDLVAVGRGALSGGDPAHAARVLGEALALWRGEPFADLADEPALREEATRLLELQLAGVECRIEADLQLGNYAAVIGDLVSLVQQYPFRERFHALLMLAYYRSGCQSEALAVYRRARAVLVAELGVEPGSELVALEQAMLRRGPGLDEYRPAPRLGLDANVRVPVQLPAGVADFAGRMAELDRLDQLVAAGDVVDAMSIVVISGTAGVGKTALAVRWAHRTAGRFPDGQLYANLRGHHLTRPARPVEVLTGFLQALGAPVSQIPAGEDAAAAMYRSLLTGRRVLVLLDNAADAEQVRPLLPGHAGCLVLVTSRDMLAGLSARDGARRLSLPPLTAPDAVALLGAMLGTNRVTAEARAAAALAGACCCLPLALRIAGARLQNEPDRGLADYLAAVRQTGPLSALRITGDEQLAVRVAFDASYRRLSAPAAELFRLLGLIPGPDFTVEAAAALVDWPATQAASLLERLAAAHLVEQSRPGRYAFHDLLREYANEQVRSAGAANARTQASDRLYRWYLRHADAAARLLFPDTLRLPGSASGGGEFLDPGDALAWLDNERTNLVAAGVAAAGDPHHREVAWLLADALRRYSWIRADSVDWPALATAGLAAASAAGNRHGQASAELGLGLADLETGKYGDGIAHLRRAITLSRQVGWADCQAVSLGNLGIAYGELGRLRLAVDHFGTARALNQQLGRTGGLATNLGNLGLLQLRMGRFGSARDHLAQALSLQPGGGGRGNKGVFLNGLGDANAHLGHTGQALDQLTQALAICAELADINDEIEVLCNLAHLHAQLGRHDDAARHADTAVARSHQSTDTATKATALTARALTRLSAGQPEQGLADSLAAAQLIVGSVSRFVHLVVLVGLATAEHHNGRPDQARVHALEVATEAATTGYRHLRGQALAIIAATYLANGANQIAARYARQALATHRRNGDQPGQAGALRLLDQALSAAQLREHRQQGADQAGANEGRLTDVC
jgi:DNA-binding SARP family transcriptional activator/tetratricopeptide (TPR) repeat protein